MWHKNEQIQVMNLFSLKRPHGYLFDCSSFDLVCGHYYLHKGNACTSLPKPLLAFRPSVGPPLSLRATAVHQSDAGGSKQAD